MIPVYLVYYFMFKGLVQIKVAYDELQEKKSSMKAVEEKEATMNKKLSIETFMGVFKKAWKYYFIMFGLFYSSYVIFTNLLKRSTINMGELKEKDCNYEILFVYSQVGTLISSASLQYLKVYRIGALLFIQFVFVLLFLLFSFAMQAYYWVLLVLIVVVGANMGLIYVNLYYQILNDSEIDKSEKELTMNIMIIAKEVAIIVNSVSGYTFNKLVPQVPRIDPKVALSYGGGSFDV